MASKTTIYRRIREAKRLNCSVGDIPDNRGKHNNHPKGSSHYKWNNQMMRDHQGYVVDRVGCSHPLADSNGYVREHIMVMVSAIGRGISANEVVHHINRDRSDNRIENLQLMTSSEHNALHIKEDSRRDRTTGRLLDGREWNEIPGNEIVKE